MGPIARILAENERKLTAAWGDPPPRGSHGGPAQVAAALKFVERLDPRQPRDGHHYLESLAVAYAHRRDPSLARAARRLFEHWLEIWPLRDGAFVPPKDYDVLQIPHRLGSTECGGWFGSLPAFLDSPEFDEPLLDRITRHARAQLNHLVTGIHDGRNIRMTQGDSLLSQSLRLTFFDDAKTWRDAGRRVIAEALHRQFNPDGSSIEATGWYHFIVANMLLRFHRLGKVMPELGIAADPDVVTRAFDYLSALTQPDGYLAIIGDSTRSLPDHGEPRVPATLELVNQRRAAIRRELGAPDSPPPTAQIFPGAGQVLLRDNWTTDATYITFDATRRSGFHWHPGANSVQIFAHGRPLLTDPGRMRYDPTPQRLNAVRTAAHNTMNLNGDDQSSAFADLTLDSAPGYHLVTGLYDGGYFPAFKESYGPGLSASHHRAMLWVMGRFIVVIDNLQHTAQTEHKPTVECNWQFAPTATPRATTLDAAAGRVVTGDRDAGLLLVSALRPEGMAMTLHEGELAPCRGWVANVGDNPVPAPFLRMHLDRFDPWNADLLTVLVPFSGDAPMLRVSKSTPPQGIYPGRVTLEWADGGVDQILWTRRLATEVGRQSEFDSDASLVHLHSTRPGGTSRAFAHRATRLLPLRNEILNRPGTFVA